MKIKKLFNLLLISLVSGCQGNVNSSLLASSTLLNTSTSSLTNVSYLTSESSGTATIKIFKDNNSASKERYIAPKHVKMKHSYSSLSGLLSNNEYVCPSIGDVNILVIPVHIPGSEKYRNEEVLSDIEKTFFGENDERNGFVSLKEYYLESSYGKLNFSGKVTDWFDLDKYTNIKSPSDITMGNDGTIISEILRKAVDWAKETQNIDLKDYDKNNDGSIDACFLVYDHLDYMSEAEQMAKNGLEVDFTKLNQAFWNFTSWDWGTFPNINEPTTSAFSWASFSSMYTSYGPRDSYNFLDLSNLKNIALDSHIYIHETGHLLGLEDYYAIDDASYRPMGKVSMMDQNVADLDSYSKMLLGWVTPYVVYGTSEILLPKQTTSEHGVIVIPSNYNEISLEIERLNASGNKEEYIYEFNPFSEYIMIDLYTPDGLNKQDSFGDFVFNRDSSMTTSGVRIYHVDSRIFKCKVVEYEQGVHLTYVDGYEWDGKSLNRNEQIFMPISNSKSESRTFMLPEEFDYFDQIRLLEANMIDTFSTGNSATNETLWKKSSSPFDIKDFGYQFFNGRYTYNNGNDLPFKIQVLTLKGVN